MRVDIVTDVPIVDLQKQLEARRRSIRDLEDQIAELKARQLTAPEDALMPCILNNSISTYTSSVITAAFKNAAIFSNRCISFQSAICINLHPVAFIPNSWG